MSSFHYVAIDPLALFLSHDMYIKINLPRPGPREVFNTDIQQVVKAMRPEEKESALAQAKALGAYARALEEELAKVAVERS